MQPSARPPTPKKAVNQQFQFGPWTMATCKSHILESEGPQKEKFDKELDLPQLPEMVFGENFLRLTHESGFGLEFNALDALRLVDAHRADSCMKVAASTEWQGARSDNPDINNVVLPFDWSYTTQYKGTLIEKEAACLKVSETVERIDVEKLKKRDPIHFYDDVLLFEDELSDHGTSILSVKVRVMPSCFFILMRLFVRVDQVLIRVNDTRVYHEPGTNFLLREFSSKEEKTANIPTTAHTEPNEVSKYLKMTCELFEKLEFASS